MPGNQEFIPDRRAYLRHKVHTPAFASFDGVTGGMILDLSDQGMSMQTELPVKARRPVYLQFSLHDPDLYIETTGYVAWADALGRAGVRFSDLPGEARQRLQEWLTLNEAAPSRKAPKLNMAAAPRKGLHAEREALELSLENFGGSSGNGDECSTTTQYEFNALGSNLDAALKLICERARSLTRGTGAAIAVLQNGLMICRARIGMHAPELNSQLELNSNFSLECIQSGRALRCDDSETDVRVNVESCRALGVRSILAAPTVYEREVLALLEVFSGNSFAFDEGDVAVVERLAQTVLLAMRQAAHARSRRGISGEARPVMTL
jgi:GAF domain-containing protein